MIHELRDYQAQAIADVRSAFRTHRRVCYQLSTGGGKSRILAEVIRLATAKRSKVLVLAPRRELIYQLQQAIERQGVPCGLVMAGEKRNVIHDVQVGSCDTLHARAIRSERMQMPPADLVLCDEFHLYVAQSRQDILNAYPEARILGVTATPARGDGRGLCEVADVLVLGPTMKELIALGHLVPMRYFSGQAPDMSKVKLNKDHDYMESKIEAEMDKPHLIGDIWDNWQRLAWDRPTVIFCSGCAHSRHVRDVFIGNGVTAEHLDGETPAAERKAILARVESGETQVLCNVYVASYGLDIPRLSCAVLARPTKNITLYLQTCLDMETEILTPEGWMHESSIANGDKVAAYDVDDGSIHWEVCENKVLRPVGREERFVRVKSPHLDIRVTDNHAMIWAPMHKARSPELYQWKKSTAGELSERGANWCLPVAGLQESIGVELSPDELRLIGLYLSDGTLGKTNGALSIAQSESQPDHHHQFIRSAIEGCGLKYGVHRSVRKGEFAAFAPLIHYSVSRGKPRGTGKHLRGHAHLEKYFVKDVSTELDTVTRQQLLYLLEGIFIGDGIKHYGSRDKDNGWTICAGRPLFVDRLQSLCVRHGLRCNVSQYVNTNGNPMWNLYIKTRAIAHVGGSASEAGRSRAVVEQSVDGENVWCVSNRLGTLITRRNGKVAIVGNCGRIMRPYEGKTDGFILDHAGALKNGFVEDEFPWSLDAKTTVKERKAAAEREKKEPRQMECSCCHNVFSGRRDCPHCGFQVIPKTEEIPCHQADLTEVSKKPKNGKTKEQREYTHADKQAWWSAILGLKQERGKSHGWALAQYRSKMGCWPRMLTDTVVEPSRTVRDWETSQRIRWIKGKQEARA